MRSLWWNLQRGGGKAQKPDRGLERAKAEFSANCPVLSLLSGLPKKEYFQSAQKYASCLAGSRAPDPDRSWREFVRFLARNRPIMFPRTEARLLRQVRAAPAQYPINAILFELPEALGSENLVLKSLPRILREDRLIHSLDLCEQLSNHFLPFLRPLPQGAGRRAEEAQVFALQVIEYAAKQCPKGAPYFHEKVSRIIAALLDVFLASEGTLAANAWRSLCTVFADAFNKSTRDNALAMVKDLTDVLIEAHPYKKLLFALLKSLRNSQFVEPNYFTVRIIMRYPMDQMDYDMLLDSSERGVEMEYPFYIMRNMIQTYIFGNENSRMAFMMISQNLRYFETCKRLHNWTMHFFKRVFQWLLVVRQVKKYKERRALLAYKLKCLYDLELFGMNDIIKSAASSLLHLIHYPEVERFFPKTDEFDHSFLEDFKGLFFPTNELKRILLWPQEKLGHARAPKAKCSLKRIDEKHRQRQREMRDSTSDSSSEYELNDSSEEDNDDKYESALCENMMPQQQQKEEPEKTGIGIDSELEEENQILESDFHVLFQPDSQDMKPERLTNSPTKVPLHLLEAAVVCYFLIFFLFPFSKYF